MYNPLEYQRKWHKEHPNYQKEQRQKKLEEKREKDRIYYQKNQDKKKEGSRKKWHKYKETYNAIRRKNYKENPEPINKKNKENYQKNKPKILKKNKEYLEKNKDKIYELNRNNTKIWYRKNKAHVKIRMKKYHENKPEITLKAQTKYLNKMSIPFSLTSHQYKRALMAWRKVIEKRDKSCVVCGSNDGLNAHHVIHRSKYPKLSFIENNGIMLCRMHHDEVHEHNLVNND